jgi:hypothetical protein
MFQGSSQALEDMKAAMEMVDASLGLSGNERTGKAISARRVEGDISNFSYVDNLCRGLRLTGRIIIGMIPKVYDTSRILRIRSHEDEEQAVPVNTPTRNDQTGEAVILNDLSVGRYGVVVDTGPSFTTMRQEASEGMMEFGQMYPEARQVIADLVAKSQDWEFAQEIADRLKRTIPQNILKDIDPSTVPPSPQEIISQSKAQIASLKVDREKLKTMQDTIKLQKEGSDVRKEILSILSELFS